MQSPPFLSLVLPCYNPHPDWLQHVAKYYGEIKKEAPLTELIIVNDGSTANFDVMEIKKIFSPSPEVNILSYPVNRGKGYALREGVKRATGEITIYTDIDFPYTRHSLLNILNALKEGDTDVAVGIRSDEYYAHLPAARVKISRVLRWFIRKFLRIPTDDTQCGLKGFNSRGKEVFLQTTINRYLFDLEFIFMAAQRKLVMKTVVVELRTGVELSSMRWKIMLQESGNFLKIFIKSIF